jgi:hypothetical protein
MQVVIIYESLTGNTERVARLIADAFYERQVPSKIYPVGGYDPAAIAEADLVIAGSWTDGLFVVGQKPAKGKKFSKLPDLTGKRCVVFCTYALDPGRPSRSSVRSSPSGAPTCSVAWRSDATTSPTAPTISSPASCSSRRPDSRSEARPDGPAPGFTTLVRWID